MTARLATMQGDSFLHKLRIYLSQLPPVALKVALKNGIYLITDMQGNDTLLLDDKLWQVKELVKKRPIIFEEEVRVLQFGQPLLCVKSFIENNLEPKFSAHAPAESAAVKEYAVAA